MYSKRPRLASYAGGENWEVSTLGKSVEREACHAVGNEGGRALDWL